MSGGNFKTEVVSGSSMITNIKVKKSKYRFVIVNMSCHKNQI